MLTKHKFSFRVNWEESLTESNSTQTIQNNSSGIEFDDTNSTTIWTDEMIFEKRHFYIYTYTISMMLVLYLVFQRSFAFFQMCLRASIKLHDKLFRGMTRATMYFFNTNPSGRILNRFSKDIGSVDTQLPVALMDTLIVSI